MMALVERLAGTARRTSGVILESSAEVCHTLNEMEYSTLMGAALSVCYPYLSEFH